MMKLGNNESTPDPVESEPVQQNHGGEQEEWKVCIKSIFIAV